MSSVAVIVLDTLRKDSFDRHFDWLPGTRFDQTYAPSHYTVPVHASLFTGQYPSSIGVCSKHERFDCDERSIVEELSDAGYSTAGFTANTLLTADRQFDRGFDTYETSWRVQLMDDDVFDWSRATREIPAGPLRDAKAIWRCIRSDSPTIQSLRLGWRRKFADHDGGRRVLEMARSGTLQSNDFLFVNLMEAHSPYRAPDGYSMPDADPVSPTTILQGDVDLSQRRERYEVAVEWLSDLYEDIFEEIQSHFDYVFTLSDHGELFGEHGARAHFHGVYPELVRVPLCVSGLDETEAKPDNVRSLLDVHQTIANLTGIETPSVGIDLRDSAEQRDCYAEYHGFRPMRLDRLRESGFDNAMINAYDRPLVGHVGPDGEYAYQHVVNGRVKCAPEERSAIETRLREVEAAVEELSDFTEELSAGAMEQLKDLGYA